MTFLPVQPKIITNLIFVLVVFLSCRGTIFGLENNLCRKSIEGTDFLFGFMENRMFKEEYRTIQITVYAQMESDIKITVGLTDAPLYSQNCSVLAQSKLTIEIPWPRLNHLVLKIFRTKGFI